MITNWRIYLFNNIYLYMSKQSIQDINIQDNNPSTNINIKRQNNEEDKEDETSSEYMKLKSAIGDPNYIQLETYKQKIYEIISAQRQICKTEITLNYSMKKIFDFISKPENRWSLIQNCLSIQTITQTQNPNLTIQKCVYELNWPHQNRQFVVKMQTRKSDQQSAIIWSSVQSQTTNPDSIQANMKIGGFIISKLTQNQSRVQYAIQANLGNAAHMLIRYFLHTQCESIWQLEHIMENYQQSQQMKIEGKRSELQVRQNGQNGMEQQYLHGSDEVSI